VVVEVEEEEEPVVRKRWRRGMDRKPRDE